MKRFLFKARCSAGSVLLCVVLLMSSLPIYSNALEKNPCDSGSLKEQIEQELMQNRVMGELVVTFCKDASHEDAISHLQKFVENSSEIKCLFNGKEKNPASKEVFLLSVNEQRIVEVIQGLRAEPLVHRVSVNSINEVEADAGNIEYSYDPIYQWALDKVGVGAAWACSFVGSNDVTVAIIDSGVAYHPDLLPNVDYGSAYDFANNDTDVSDGNTQHGTFIAGIVGAALDGENIVGVCQNVRILPIKAHNGTDSGISQRSLSAFQNSIGYAYLMGADIISISTSLSQNEADAMEDLNVFQGLYIVSAGNHNSLVEIDMPSKANDYPNWIVVGASTALDRLWYEDETRGTNYSR